MALPFYPFGTRLVTATGDHCTDDTADAVKTKLVDAAGNALAKFGHDKTGVGHGVETVDTVGTHQKLSTTSVAAKVVIIQAQTDNTSGVAVGGDGVDATVATGNGILLYAGDWTPPLEIDNLQDIWIDALVQHEGVRYIYFT